MWSLDMKTKLLEKNKNKNVQNSFLLVRNAPVPNPMTLTGNVFLKQDLSLLPKQVSTLELTVIGPLRWHNRYVSPASTVNLSSLF